MLEVESTHESYLASSYIKQIHVEGEGLIQMQKSLTV